MHSKQETHELEIAAASADHLRAKLDDEFETVAKPQGLRRTSDARREQEAEAGDAPDQWRRSSEEGGARRGRRAATDQEGQDAGDKPARKGPSLKMRAVGYLSRREHAREELARKLAAYAGRPGRSRGRARRTGKRRLAVHRALCAKPGTPPRIAPGAARIVQELRQHGVDDNQVAELREQLRATEYDRALEVWKKRFSARPEDRAAYAKQARFLASRGFAP